MQDTSNTPSPDETQQAAVSPWRITGWICLAVIATSVVSCMLMAVLRSDGLIRITVTALDEAVEPRDHALPFLKQKEALPDYELILILADGGNIRLGAKPDTSATEGLTWHVPDPMSIVDVASVRLQDQDKLISDPVAEVQILGDSTNANGYRFDFVSARSTSVGVKSFFGTPIGKAILAGFCIAVVLLLAAVFCA